MTIINKVITVIVPVYKVEKYLDRCVESIVNQTYKNLEIILVDDGSPDNSPEICDEWAKKDSRIKVIHKENGGVSSARNAGLDVATGEYIGFVDSDDWLKDDMYEYLIHLLQEYNAQISCTSYYTVNEDMNIDEELLQEEISTYNYNDIIKNLTKPFAFSLCTKLYKRSLFNNLPLLPENLTFSEDIMLNYFLYKNTDKLVLSNLPKYYYFRHCESAIAGRIKYSLIDDSSKALTIVDNDFDKSSEVYPYFLSFKVFNDYFLLNSIVRNNDCWDRYDMLKKDILKNKKYIFNKKYKDVFVFKHRFGTFLLMISPFLYNQSILIRRKIRGY